MALPSAVAPKLWSQDHQHQSHLLEVQILNSDQRLWRWNLAINFSKLSR